MTNGPCRNPSQADMIRRQADRIVDEYPDEDTRNSSGRSGERH